MSLAESRGARNGELAEWLRDAIANRDRSEGCWIWPFGSSNGYGALTFEGRQMRASQAALLMDGQPRPDGLLALHSCDNPPCCNPAHLRWGTYGDNAADAVGRGRRTNPRFRGELHPQAKLTASDVRLIRRRLAAGERQRIIAADYGVSRSAIANIAQGRRWPEAS